MSALHPLPTPRTVGVFSHGIARIPHLRAFLGAERVILHPTPLSRVDCVVGWGQKPNTTRARRFAAREGVPYLTLEDGFLRSLGLGVEGAPPLSIVVDDIGVYYDATAPSRLERILGAPDELDANLLERARTCIARIREARLSKYNVAPLRTLGPRDRPRVLVVDQTAGDLSIARGRCVPEVFHTMLQAALDEHPQAEVIVKTHPDVASGKKRGHFSAALRRDARIRMLSESTNPIGLLEEVDHVYVATSLLGLEALLVGRPVTCFGVPFYAGWGLTDDRAPIPARRNRRRSVEELVAAAYLQYARYIDPETGTRCEAESVIEHLALQRQMADDNAGTTICVGFSSWRRSFAPAFLSSPRGGVRFARDAAGVRRELRPGVESRIVVWGVRENADLRALAAESKVPLWRMEDGFLRSVGLGSDLHAPASLVVDREGIYYDARVPSDLERILAEATFSSAELERARRLRERIVQEGLTKYNLRPSASRRLARASGRDVVLVIGQVEGDASLALGGVDVRQNEALLRAARRARPHAYLVYKPHPDVVSKNREDSLPLSVAERLCDEIIVDVGLAECLASTGEVHTMTSLVGFEALLRGISVHVYGQPFYSGWGLTTDRHPHPRRRRRLTLDELVAGALIRYPRYVHPVTGTYTTPEAIVDHLSRERQHAPSSWTRSWPARQSVKLVNLLKGAFHAS